MHSRLPFKADFVLGRVDIHIHFPRWKLNKESNYRITPSVNDATICLHDRMLNDLITNKTAINIGV